MMSKVYNNIVDKSEIVMFMIKYLDVNFMHITCYSFDMQKRRKIKTGLQHIELFMHKHNIATMTRKSLTQIQYTQVLWQNIQTANAIYNKLSTD